MSKDDVPHSMARNLFPMLTNGLCQWAELCIEKLRIAILQEPCLVNPHSLYYLMIEIYCFLHDFFIRNLGFWSVLKSGAHLGFL